MRAAADAGRGNRCRQRDTRRHRLRDALGRIGDGQIPGGSGDDAGEDRRVHRSTSSARQELRHPTGSRESKPTTMVRDRMASDGACTEPVPCELVLVPTRGGNTARAISRIKPTVWIVCPRADWAACQGLAFSYGVNPVDLGEEPNGGANGSRDGSPKTASPPNARCCSSPAPHCETRKPITG